MTWPEHLRNVNRNRVASAPYNFVPLPETVVPAPHQSPAFHDTYKVEGHPHTGYFDVVLTTLSPLYVRCPFTVEEFQQAQQQSNRLPFRAQIKNKPDFFHTRDPDQPVIPGSSLRGMLRNLLEIVSYSKIERVTDQDKIFFRALFEPDVADDSLVLAYQERLGKLGKNVEAGYLTNVDGQWHVRRAAISPSGDPDDPYAEPGIKIKEDDILTTDLPDLVRFNDPGYTQQYHTVSFDADVDSMWIGPSGRQRKRRFWRITQIGTRSTGLPYEGVLVCSGNMLETNDGSKVSPRSSHIVVLEPDPDDQLILITDQAVADYKNTLTSFQKEHFDEDVGCLKEGAPVFFTVDANHTIRNFGHSPFFRVAAFNDHGHAVSPRDLIPDSLSRSSTVVDYSDALFGFTGGSDGFESCAGRVSVTDATPVDESGNLWLASQKEYQILEPQILSTPKPTAYQHYLVQQSDEREKLRHYDASSESTIIRGHKLYWHQGNRSAYYIQEQEHKGDHLDPATGRVREDSTQHTQMRPVRPEVRFKFRIYFENLSDAELGALCWTLEPQGDPAVMGHAQRAYHHKLGMGKPLGMGSVRLDATLYLTDRTSADEKNRYRRLFDGDAWHIGLRRNMQGGHAVAFSSYITRFEQHVLNHLKSINGAPQAATQLWEIDRIKALLKMMEWPGFPAKDVPRPYLNQEQRPNTRYMTPEEYRQRPVLPHPLDFPDPNPYHTTLQPPPQGVEWPTAAPATAFERPSVDPRAAQDVSSAPRARRYNGHGRILNYNMATREGMIQPEDDGEPIPFRLSEVKNWSDLGMPSADRRVSFTAETTPEGPRALRVELI